MSKPGQASPTCTSKTDAAVNTFTYPSLWDGVSWFPKRERDRSRALRWLKETFSFAVTVAALALIAGVAINALLGAAVAACA